MKKQTLWLVTSIFILFLIVSCGGGLEVSVIQTPDLQNDATLDSFVTILIPGVTPSMHKDHHNPIDLGSETEEIRFTILKMPGIVFSVQFRESTEKIATLDQGGNLLFTIDLSTTTGGVWPIQITAQRLSPARSLEERNTSHVTLWIALHNDAPESLVYLSPAYGATIPPPEVTLRWLQGTDAQGDPITYYIYGGLTENPPLLSVQTDESFTWSGLESGSTYYWRVDASDGRSISPRDLTAGPIWFFTVREQEYNPPSISLLSPEDGATNLETTVHFTWIASPGDPSSSEHRAGASISFIAFYLTKGTAPFGAPQILPASTASVTVDTLDYDSDYRWKVLVLQSDGQETESQTRAFLTMQEPADSVIVYAQSSPSDGGWIQIDSQGWKTADIKLYETGSTVTLTAQARSGWTFHQWQEEGAFVSGVTPYTFTANTDRNVIASFVQEEEEDPVEQVTVSAQSQPSSEGWIQIDDRGWKTSDSKTYDAGTTVTVGAQAKSGWSFQEWREGGAFLSAANPYVFTANANRNIVAYFTADEEPVQTVTISAQSQPSSGGRIQIDNRGWKTTDSKIYNVGTTVTLAAQAQTGWSFQEWREGGNFASAANPYVFSAASNRTLVAWFTEDEEDDDDDNDDSPFDHTSPYTGNRLVANNRNLDGQTYQHTGTLNTTSSQRVDLPLDLPLEAYQIDVVLSRPEGLDHEDLVTPAAIEPRYSLGQEKEFWTHNFKTNSFEKINAQLRAIGTHALVWVSDKEIGGFNYNSLITDAQANQIANEFDTKIYPLVTTHFYTPSDVNGDGKIAILLFDIQDNFDSSGSYVGGYFYSGDLYTHGSSNHMEIFYIDTYPTMHYPRSNPIDVSRSYSTLAHEFQHMVNFNRNVLIEKGYPMTLWIDEGLSMAAEHLVYGALHSRISFYNASGFIRDGHSVLFWDQMNPLPNYALSYLFMQYFRIQMGLGNGIYRQLIESSRNDAQALQNLLNAHYGEMTLADFLVQWRIAMLLKESSGSYGFGGESAFNNIQTRMYEGSGRHLRGGGTLIKSKTQPFTHPEDSGTDIQFIGVNIP